MSEYTFVKGSKLSLKGEKRKKKHKKDSKSDSGGISNVELEESNNHGGWWPVKKFGDITGAIAIETSLYSYIRALDNGLFVSSAPHHKGEIPDQEEILTAVKCSETHIALKSGFNKYLSIDNQNRLVGRSDAIGTREQFEPVFQEGKMALIGANSCFLAPDNAQDGLISAKSKTAGDDEFITIRTNIDPYASKRNEEAKAVPLEEKGSLADCEVNYVKKYQSFQDRKLRVNKDERSDLKKAKTEGTLHEKLLDRRAKMKSDKFCK